MCLNMSCSSLIDLPTTHTLSGLVQYNMKLKNTRPYVRTMYLSSLACRSSRRLSERDPELMSTGSYVVD